MTLKEYALKILSDAGCRNDCYYNITVEEAEKDLHEAFPDRLEFDYREVAEMLVTIGNETPHYPTKPTDDITTNGYACRWGVTDFTDESRRKLGDLLDSGKPFKTEWCSCSKTEDSFQISSDGVSITIEVQSWIDDGYGLIDDAIWQCGYSDDDFTDEMREEVYEIMYDSMLADICTETSCKMTLPHFATFGDIVSSLAKLSEQNHQKLDIWFENLTNVVNDIKYNHDMNKEDE